METKNYLTNWLTFVDYVISMFNEGKNEIDISKKFSGNNVVWEGRIKDIKLDEEYSPGVALTMKPETVPISKEKIMRADYLFLNIEANTASQWKNCKIGDNVKFKAKISKSKGPFPEVQLSEDTEDPEVLLMVGLYDCEFVGKID